MTKYSVHSMTVDGYKAPSRHIGSSENMPFLWNDWGLTDHSKLQHKILNLRDAETTDAVIKHISKVEPDFLNLSNISWVVFGVLSQYNFDDIWYFCTVDWFMRDPAIYEEQEAMGWGGNGWIMSPITLARVKEFRKAAA